MSGGAPRLARETFKVSRRSEFASERELVAQTGHPVDDWPLVIVKELADNGIDSTEEAGVAPVVEIAVSTERGEIIVTDNGPGIATEVVTSILDLTARTSARALYVSPTRGQQGNALSTIIAMAFVLDGQRGETVIEAHGKAHLVTFTVNPISGEPQISWVLAPTLVKTGTKIAVKWPSVACPLLTAAKGRFLQLIVDYTVLNPHLTISLDWDATLFRIEATTPDFRKWLPSDPVPPHWLDDARFAPYIAARIRRDQARGLDRPLREFVGEFRGLTSTVRQKAIIDDLGAGRLTLSRFFSDGDGNVNRIEMAKLLHAMQRNTRPVKAGELGVIGKDHLRAYCIANGADAASFRYERFLGESAVNPFVVEAAFAWCPGADERTITSGINFSPAIGKPFQRLRYRSLDDVLAVRSCDESAPIVLLLHYVCPHVTFADRGKSVLTPPAAHAEAIVDTVKGVTASWHKKHEASARAEHRDRERLAREQERRWRDRERAERAEEREATANVVGTGALHRVIAEATEAKGVSLADLTVLSNSNDPYRQDSHVGRLLGEWFKGQVERFSGQIHLRRLHYMVASVNDVIKPDDKALYINSFEHWRWLQSRAAKAARWLQYTPFERIIDNRNKPPESFIWECTETAPPIAGIECGDDTSVPIPDLEKLRPRASCRGLSAPQPYRVILFGEKSSLHEDLQPIAREIGAELLLPTGEISDTLIAELAKRAAADPRPAVVLYVADFDPAGFQMPVSVGRKLQALRHLLYPGLRIEVHRAALTLEQCIHFDLPSIPLKESERRADKWRARMGREQTEIDALMALHPGALRQIVLEAAAPFWDQGLTTRASIAEAAWEEEANALLVEHATYAEALADIENARAGLIEAVRGLQSAQHRMVAKLLEIELPPTPDVVEPEIEATAPSPLFDSTDDFITATIKLRAEKAMDDEDGTWAPASARRALR